MKTLYQRHIMRSLRRSTDCRVKSLKELNRKLSAVLDAKKKEPTKETEEEYVKPPVLETRVLHI